MKTKLTAMQNAYVKAVLSGLSGSDSARKAGANGNPVRIAQRSRDWLRLPHIKAAIEAGKAKAAAKFEWSRDEMLGTLKEIAAGADNNGDRVRAITQASKMLGTDAPVKSEISGGLVVRWEE